MSTKRATAAAKALARKPKAAETAGTKTKAAPGGAGAPYERRMADPQVSHG